MNNRVCAFCGKEENLNNPICEGCGMKFPIRENVQSQTVENPKNQDVKENDDIIKIDNNSNLETKNDYEKANYTNFSDIGLNNKNNTLSQEKNKKEKVEKKASQLIWIYIGIDLLLGGSIAGLISNTLSLLLFFVNENTLFSTLFNSIISIISTVISIYFILFLLFRKNKLLDNEKKSFQNKICLYYIVCFLVKIGMLVINPMYRIGLSFYGKSLFATILESLFLGAIVPIITLCILLNKFLNIDKEN